MTAKEKRLAVRNAYKEILGRNIYSQNAVKRECCFKPYSNGKYYSDCSSSIRLAYKKAGIGLNNIGDNTVGIIQNKNAVKVPCAIKNGVPTNIPALRVADCLMFAGGDESRKYAEYVGHVEMVYSIKDGVVTLCGHGSGNPKTHKMVSYCKTRQSTKADTKRGNRGLIKVLRFIQDDDDDLPEPITPDDPTPVDEGGKYRVLDKARINVRMGPGTQYSIARVAKGGELLVPVDVPEGWLPIMEDGRILWVSSKYIEEVDWPYGE